MYCPRQEPFRRLLTCPWANYRPLWREVPSVTMTSFDAQVARRSRRGAAIRGVVCPWTEASVALLGALPEAALTHAPAGYPGATGNALAVTPNPRPRTLVVAPKTVGTGVTPSGQPIDNQQYVHMTRVNAGGDGASGPHPERAPA